MDKLGNFISYDPDNDKLLLSASDIVCSHVYQLYGESAIKFIDPKLIEFITKLMRTKFAGKYMLINNYMKTSLMDLEIEEPISEERGLRCNMCYTLLVRTDLDQCYVNSHTLGKGIDFDIYDKVGDKMERYTPASIKNYIQALVELEGDYIRMDLNDTDWVHIDVMTTSEPAVQIKSLENYAGEPPALFVQKSSELVNWSGNDGFVPAGFSGVNFTPSNYDYSQMNITYSPSTLANIKPEEIHGISQLMKYNPGATEAQIRERVLAVALNMGSHPNWLMAVMMSESGGNPQIWNGKVAVGLIQFTRPACDTIGTTQSYLANLSVYEQLFWVNKYYQVSWVFGGKKKVQRLSDVYVATFAPAYIGKPGDYRLYSHPTKGYTQNKALDYGNKGYITVDDMLVRTVKVAKNFGISL